MPVRLKNCEQAFRVTHSLSGCETNAAAVERLSSISHSSRRARVVSNKRSSRCLALALSALVGLSAPLLHPIHGHAQTIHRRVLIVGGSAALGWKDDGWRAWRTGWHGGYIERAISVLARSRGEKYDVQNISIPGLNATLLATRFKGRYEASLASFHPDIVVISWGLMNDIRPRTPFGELSKRLSQEIHEARTNGAAVYVVTPPITTASYTFYRDIEPTYVKTVLNTARTCRESEVHVVDLFHTMERFVESSGVSYKAYEGDALHPNHQGHVLAGDLLAALMNYQFVSLAKRA